MIISKFSIKLSQYPLKKWGCKYEGMNKRNNGEIKKKKLKKKKKKKVLIFGAG